MKTYILTNADGKRYESATPGTLGGHKLRHRFARPIITNP